VQGFLDASAPAGPGITIAPLDSFCFRPDLDLCRMAFEMLGNDENYNEVPKDQMGATEFRARYVLRVHDGPYDQADTVAWSRTVAAPLLQAVGEVSIHGPSVDPARAVSTCLKPVDDTMEGGVILRLWETAGKDTPINVTVPGVVKAVRTDLLERDQEDLPIKDGAIALPVKPLGFTSVRLIYQ
jgi:alpha-mannosidase